MLSEAQQFRDRRNGCHSSALSGEKRLQTAVQQIVDKGSIGSADSSRHVPASPRPNWRAPALAGWIFRETAVGHAVKRENPLEHAVGIRGEAGWRGERNWVPTFFECL
jgi:hypothetical protein